MKKRLTVEEQARVDIARDALAWEEAGALDINVQHYLRGRGGRNIYDLTDGMDPNAQARDVVLGPCSVCALGGLLLAKAVRFNAVSVKDLRDLRVNRLEDHFSVDQINEIEAAFEGKSYPEMNFTHGRHVVNYEWRLAFPDPKERFRAIMRNIIRNRGTFVPNDIQR